ncbi:ABC transporter ATP-binding protein [Arthrobacter sp. D1-29]
MSTIASVTAPPAVSQLIGVSKHYSVRLAGGGKGVLQAVDGADLTVRPGKTLGLVGESGSGKSTIARLMLKLVEPTAGSVFLDGEDITGVRGSRLRALRSKMQLVFQDPYSSFDPRADINDSLGEALRPLGLNRTERARKSAELLETVGLPSALGARRPRDLSGGQLQRAAIARALSLSPKLIALDEPVSSLDVSSQVHIINLLNKLQEELGVSMLFISHDLTVVRDVSHDIAVMYLGKVVERGASAAVYSSPRHPYTEALLSAAPRMTAASDTVRVQRILLRGDIPSPLRPPAGCRFHTRCPKVMDVCRTIVPEVVRTPLGDEAACHLLTDTQMVPSGAGRGRSEDRT